MFEKNDIINIRDITADVNNRDLTVMSVIDNRKGKNKKPVIIKKSAVDGHGYGPMQLPEPLSPLHGL